MTILRNRKSGFLLGTFAIFFAMTACNQSPSGMATFRNIGNNSNPNGSEKISQKTPPVYNTQQWTVGSYWVWKERKAPKVAKCIRWTIAELSNAGGVSVEQKITQDCKSYDGVKANHFHFFPITGEIDTSDYKDLKEGSSIFGFLFGDDRVATHYRLKQKLPWGGVVTVYRMEGGKSWYLDAQETMLQGVLWQNDHLQLVEYHDSRQK